MKAPCQMQLGPFDTEEQRDRAIAAYRKGDDLTKHNPPAGPVRIHPFRGAVTGKLYVDFTWMTEVA